MKKILYIVMTALLLLSVSACGTDKSNSTKEDDAIYKKDGTLKKSKDKKSDQLAEKYFFAITNLNFKDLEKLMSDEAIEKYKSGDLNERVESVQQVREKWKKSSIEYSDKYSKKIFMVTYGKQENNYTIVYKDDGNDTDIDTEYNGVQFKGRDLDENDLKMLKFTIKNNKVITPYEWNNTKSIDKKNTFVKSGKYKDLKWGE